MPKVLNKRTDKIPPDAVYVGRPSKWGNPFKIHKGKTGLELHLTTREEVITRYCKWITKEEGKYLLLRLGELKGKDLVCWCSPLPCHADILLELANKES